LRYAAERGDFVQDLNADSNRSGCTTFIVNIYRTQWSACKGRSEEWKVDSMPSKSTEALTKLRFLPFNLKLYLDHPSLSHHIKCNAMHASYIIPHSLLLVSHLAYP
jgi:hypothetical protein